MKIGFLKHFTRVRGKDAVILAIMMNIISFIIEIPVLYKVLSIIMEARSYWIAAFESLLIYIFMLFFCAWIEGEIIQIKIDYSISKTFRWLSVANAISIGISVIFVWLFVHLYGRLCL